MSLLLLHIWGGCRGSTWNKKKRRRRRRRRRRRKSWRKVLHREIHN